MPLPALDPPFIIIMEPDTRAHAMGCLVGLFTGDAAGAPLEFYRPSPDRTDVDVLENALHMRGGGALGVAPGQVTDDSERAMALLRGLRGAHPMHDGFPADRIAAEYVAWHGSRPFDVGATCGGAFCLDQGGAAGMRARAAARNMESESNGALMRVAPLAIWARGLPVETVMDFARQDAQLSHPSQECQDANAAYCAALAHLVAHPGDAAGAVALVDNVVAPGLCPAVRRWLEDSTQDETLGALPATRHPGHVRHAFTLAFWFLRRRTMFRPAIRHTLRKLGDTDTNAAIVGAMLGALHGMNGIPIAMCGPVLAFDCHTWDARAKGVGHARPLTCNARHSLADLSATLESEQV